MTAHTFLIAIVILCVVSSVLAIGSASAGALVRMLAAGGHAPNWIKATALGVLSGMVLPFFLMLCLIGVAGGRAVFGLCLLTTPIVAFTVAYLYTQPLRKK